MSQGRIVILSGPSGVGKDTVLDAWMDVNPRVAKVVTTTTRAPRPGEVPGEDYHFATPEEFEAKRLRGEFIEAKQVHGNWYASPLRETLDAVDQGRIAVLKIDVQGAAEAVTKLPDPITVFLMPPSAEELERRIRARAKDSEESIRLRVRNAVDEMAMSDSYEHIVINDDLAQAVESLNAVVEREILRGQPT